MNKIPFSVSARTARLIGRENVSNAEGALIELVKNSYDADASVCIVLFHNRFAGVPAVLSPEEYKDLTLNPNFKKVKELYIKDGTSYTLTTFTENRFEDLENFFASYLKILIADDGSGMDNQIIKNQWMMIGTSNKLNSFISKKNRVQTGAKGIGRFALDRLGSRCELFTIPEGSKKGFIWRVNWEDFEKKDMSIDKVYAELEDSQKIDVNKVVGGIKDKRIALFKKNFQHGTILEISDLRDIWKKENIKEIYSVLELLTPAETFHDFKMYVFDSANPTDYGEVKNFVNEDYDYAIKAKFNEYGEIDLKVYRNEFDIDRIDSGLFEKESMQKFPYRKEDLKKAFFDEKLKITDLLPGFNNQHLLTQVGVFEFNFYFIKRGTSTREKEMFFFKDINMSARNQWLDSFGGIKLFRDRFRIRPYGEKGAASDWLGLGDRAAKSPAGFAQRYGEFRVRQYQIAGEVNISRLMNINFEDKSSREGLQENDHFKLFKNILLGIIGYFERDREYLGINMKEYYEEKKEDEKIKNDAQEIVNRLTEDDGKPKTQELFSEANTSVLTEQNKTIAKGFNIIKQEKEDLLTELKMLRTLASSGLVITTFAHELRQLGSTLSRRADEIEKCLKAVVDEDKLNKIPEHKNPYKRLIRLKEDDIKLKNWIDFSIDAVQKSKRERVKININRYVENFANYWNDVISYKKAEIKINSSSKKVELRLFPIDIDSILNNLLANSLYAFLRKDAPDERTITINIKKDDVATVIGFEDTGPGLDSSISNPDQIFDLFFTTKVNDFGEKTGTGLGMWIVKSIMKEYKGSVKINKIRPGFSLELTFPNT